ncbi:DUF3857 domain-containing protein [Siansivirga zeaxanthinifaciens]|uniref:Uncharacterized protein n=1 Tax=Siansivirga zeaxanthinifaciens CC-SAMT-1 TaxID=1454006 RepID=A0A0C5WPR0_9FLAO|nr:DUF3857 domain-containing protein [Siansivirga zeaxanthinifaciens]AJR04925.1 hypothetical protein AW14_10810 [Siansivirga zeaxanthinifaciens CC-SAMT-1]
MKTFFTLFLLFLRIVCFSQEKYNSENYIVTLDDIKSTTFLKDSTANALVIYEQGKSHVDRNEYHLITVIKRKIKLLKREGFDNANIVIPLYITKTRYEEVESILATTYNYVNGKITKTQLEKKDIFTEAYDENHTLIKFTLPNIKEGSVITYSYKLISPFMFNYKSWNFQSEIPKLYSEYNASIPANWDYHVKLIGGKKLFKNESVIEKRCLEVSDGSYADCSNSMYVMKDIPAFIKENYMTTKSNYLARIEYELKTFQDFQGQISNYAKTWETVDKELKIDKNIGKQLSKSVDFDEILPAHIINESDPLKKATAIYQFVQNNFTWNEEFQIFKDVSIKDLLKEKSGNVSSINILLHNLLDTAGIDVKPILLSTRENGLITTIFPVISEFNYLIVQATINGTSYFLDGTDKFISFGDLPFRCLNQFGRTLDLKNGSDWIDIKPGKASTYFYKADLNFEDDQNLTGTVNTKYTGYHAIDTKKRYFSNKEAYLEDLENKSPYIEINDYEVENNILENPDFQETYTIDYDLNTNAESIYLNPFFKIFFSENPFKLQERTYPIDFGYPDNYFYMVQINLNNKYEVIEKPKEIMISLPNNTGSLRLSCSLLNNSVMLMMKVEFKESIYPPEYYPYLKEFMAKVVDTQKNSIILFKKI